MGYSFAFRKKFEKNLKGYKKPAVQEEILDSIEHILADPGCGDVLSGNWSGFRKLSFSEKPELRLIYKFYDCCGESDGCHYNDKAQEDCQGHIDFLFLLTREECNNLYAKDAKYVQNFDREA